MIALNQPVPPVHSASADDLLLLGSDSVASGVQYLFLSFLSPDIISFQPMHRNVVHGDMPCTMGDPGRKVRKAMKLGGSEFSFGLQGRSER